ncbi:hypothetical protein OE09_1219 [Flavobacteriaceae bacterium MAR_2010_72]|nr:hypothetical protein OE09_1219 [Flavobacteriaceae bacterium MAR_2010_72]
MNEIFKSLRNNLAKSYIFYIPDKLYNVFQRTPIKDLVSYEATNRVAYVDRNGDTTTNEDLFKRLDIFAKYNIFEENVIILLEAQSKLDTDLFQYLLDKYWELLDSHTYITGLLFEHISNYIQNVPEPIKSLFDLQRDVFLTHHNKMRNTFTSLKSKYIGVDSKGAFMGKFEGLGSNHKTSDTISVQKSTISKTPKPKKPPLITDTEADAFLLESVFNIKVKNGSKGNEKLP